ncbi:MAG TPA: hypothetical protein VK464_19760, partial [Symbiobacteriaceae bacterium]|nr:hypothetical protein [Symbiobacteriaceae bacterium]
NRRGTDTTDKNFVVMPAKPASGTRTDLVFLEVFEKEVKTGDTLFKYGTEYGRPTITNDLRDSRIGYETTRRLVLAGEIRVATNATDPATDGLGGNYTSAGNGLFRSTNGRLAIELFTVSRTSAETALASPAAAYVLVRSLVTLNGSSLLDGSVATVKVADLAITTAKVADGAVTYPKLADTAIASLQAGMGLGGAPSDPSSNYGFTPILRFWSTWTNNVPMVSTWAPRYASSWANGMVEKNGNAWNFFRGIEYMSQTTGFWFDKNVEWLTLGGWYYADNVSVLCLQNTNASAQTFNPYVYYSSAYGNNTNASASVSYKLIDPLTKPTLAADFSSAWEATSSTYSTNNFSVSVPAGQVVIFALKTSPHLWGSNGANDYSNYHGFYNFATGAMPNFRPHLATYRRLLQGKWD